MKMNMKKLLLFLGLLLSGFTFAQSNGITYQAVIYNPNGEVIPGAVVMNAPLANTNICLKFTIVDENFQTEYQETLTTTTDEYGMVNLLIGSGEQIGGYATSFGDIFWNMNQKGLKVALDMSSNCLNFVEISDQLFSSVPYAFSAQNAENVTGVVSIENGGTNAVTVQGALQNFGLDNVDNTSDLNKPISTATQTALDTKENSSNKSLDITTDGLSDVKFPSVKAVKTYVDANASIGSAALAAEVARALAAEGTIATNLNTEISRAIAAELTKEDLVNKTTSIPIDGSSDVKYPTAKAVKNYVDSNSSLSSSALQAEITRALAAENNIASSKNDVTEGDSGTYMDESILENIDE